MSYIVQVSSIPVWGKYCRDTNWAPNWLNKMGHNKKQLFANESLSASLEVSQNWICTESFPWSAHYISHIRHRINSRYLTIANIHNHHTSFYLLTKRNQPRQPTLNTGQVFIWTDVQCTQINKSVLSNPTPGYPLYSVHSYK